MGYFASDAVIKLTYDETDTELPGDLFWEDEFNWASAAMYREYSCRGALLISTGSKQAGRPITLVSPDSSRGWFTRSQVKALLQLVEVEGREYTLTLVDARTFTVMFDTSKDACQFNPLIYRENLDEDGEPNYTGRISLIVTA